MLGMLLGEKPVSSLAVHQLSQSGVQIVRLHDTHPACALAVLIQAFGLRGQPGIGFQHRATHWHFNFTGPFAGLNGA